MPNAKPLETTTTTTSNSTSPNQMDAPNADRFLSTAAAASTPYAWPQPPNSNEPTEHTKFPIERPQPAVGDILEASPIPA